MEQNLKYSSYSANDSDYRDSVRKSERIKSIKLEKYDNNNNNDDDIFANNVPLDSTAVVQENLEYKNEDNKSEKDDSIVLKVSVTSDDDESAVDNSIARETIDTPDERTDVIVYNTHPFFASKMKIKKITSGKTPTTNFVTKPLLNQTSLLDFFRKSRSPRKFTASTPRTTKGYFTRSKSHSLNALNGNRKLNSSSANDTSALNIVSGTANTDNSLSASPGWHVKNNFTKYCIQCSKIYKIGSKMNHCGKCKLLLKYKCIVCVDRVFGTIQGASSHLKYHLRKHLNNVEKATGSTQFYAFICTKCGETYAASQNCESCKVTCKLKCLLCNTSALYRGLFGVMLHIKKEHASTYRRSQYQSGEDESIAVDVENDNNSVLSTTSRNKSEITVKEQSLSLALLYCTKCKKTNRIVKTVALKTCKKCQLLMRYKCINCKKFYKSYQNFVYHLNLTCTTLFRYNCSECDFTTLVSLELKKHMDFTHCNKENTLPNKINEIRKYEIAQKQMSQRETDLVDEEAANVSKGKLRKKSKTCLKCQAKISDEKFHEKYCGKALDKSCTLCSFKTKYKSSLKKHEQLHLKEANAANESLLDKTDVQVAEDVNQRSDRKFYDNDPSNYIEEYCVNCCRVPPIIARQFTMSKCKKCKTNLLYRCVKCNVMNTKREFLLRHVKRHITKALFTCKTCRKTFGVLKHLKIHETICTS